MLRNNIKDIKIILTYTKVFDEAFTGQNLRKIDFDSEEGKQIICSPIRSSPRSAGSSPASGPSNSPKRDPRNRYGFT